MTQTYNKEIIDALVRCYPDIKDEEDDFAVRDELMDLEAALEKLPYGYVSIIYEHGMKGLSFRELEVITNTSRMTLQRKYWEGINLLMEEMNAN